jgi:Zn-dependent peptidase ImmA (M78 family)
MVPTADQLLHRASEMRKQKGYIDVVSLAREYDVEVVSEARPFENYNAQIVYDRENAKHVMHVNETHSVERQRFSIAHELGHLVLHDEQLQTLGKLDRSGSSELEKEADEFAAKLLMPEDGVKQYFDTLRLDSEQVDVSIIKSLATQFRVSRAVAIIRLRELGYYVPYIQLA